jgi:hypothetical protein
MLEFVVHAPGTPVREHQYHHLLRITNGGEGTPASVNDLTGILLRRTYEGSTTISGTGASNSPKTIPVTFYGWR